MTVTWLPEGRRMFAASEGKEVDIHPNDTLSLEFSCVFILRNGEL
jgi:hypothetical protein